MTPDETTSEEKSSRSYWGFVLWPLAVIVLYVLSAGPVMRAYMNDTVGDGVFVVYSPLLSVCDRTPVKKALGLYMHLWCPDRYDKHGDMIGAGPTGR